jgi:hypothetical protein
VSNARELIIVVVLTAPPNGFESDATAVAEIRPREVNHRSLESTNM